MSNISTENHYEPLIRRLDEMHEKIIKASGISDFPTFNGSSIFKEASDALKDLVQYTESLKAESFKKESETR